MTIQRLTIFNLSDIQTQKVSIKHNNAFIFPDGRFCLASGYMGADSSIQVEASALQLSEEIIGIHNLKAKYDTHLQGLAKKGMNWGEVNSKRLYYLKNILVHYYGYCLFARVQRMDVAPEVEQFWDYTILPDASYNDKEATEMQMQTLKALFELNDDGTILPSWNEVVIKEKMEKILIHK